MATSLVSLIDLRDRYTGGHSQRVAKYVRGIAMQMCLSDDETEMIVFAASLHDIGKIGVPDHILLKPGPLTDEEFGWIRKHPEWGWIAVRNVTAFKKRRCSFCITTNGSMARDIRAGCGETKSLSDRASSPWRILTTHSRRIGHIARLAPARKR